MKNVLFDFEVVKNVSTNKKWEIAFSRTEAALKVLYAKGYPCAELLLESLRNLDALIAGGLPQAEASKLLQVSTHYLRRARRSRALIKALRSPGKVGHTAVCSLIKRAVAEIDYAVGMMAHVDMSDTQQREKISNQLISALFSVLSAEMQSRELSS